MDRQTDFHEEKRLRGLGKARCSPRSRGWRLGSRRRSSIIFQGLRPWSPGGSVSCATGSLHPSPGSATPWLRNVTQAPWTSDSSLSRRKDPTDPRGTLRHEQRRVLNSWDAGSLYILPELTEDQQRARYPPGSDGVESFKTTTHTDAHTRAHTCTHTCTHAHTCTYAHTHSYKQLRAVLESEHVPPDGVLDPESL